ncbi:hypothetical protein PBAL39_20570 [Pedobacter sp. BAL39]|uniref:hypothetical protein n=1 Tax=Pedobacter sp. BAL39 TaxID=391596 RepID=UPI000155926F|nr:hypothetical protein [Pedobacter sp. BAL39]EDM38505.1 hypothetical protein PBAL39_20570 [Pedobacter sp. BAL39]
MDLTTMQQEEVFKKITWFNRDKGICGFASSFCYLYSVSGSQFLRQIQIEHDNSSKNQKYLALVEEFNKKFKDVDHFSWFIASNVIRWTETPDANIQELKEFAIIFSQELKAGSTYNKGMESHDGVADFFIKIGIPLTPGNIQNILGKYLQSDAVEDSISGKFTGLVDYAKEKPDLVTIIGLCKNDKADIAIHYGLRHWVFKNAAEIYNHGEIQSAESIAVNYPFVCNSIKLNRNSTGTQIR